MILKILSNLSGLIRVKEIKPTNRRHSHNSTRDITDIAAIDLKEIGWWHMLQGRISMGWEESHVKHMAQRKSQPNPCTCKTIMESGRNKMKNK